MGGTSGVHGGEENFLRGLRAKREGERQLGSPKCRWKKK